MAGRTQHRWISVTSLSPQRHDANATIVFQVSNGFKWHKPLKAQSHSKPSILTLDRL